MIYKSLVINVLHLLFLERKKEDRVERHKRADGGYRRVNGGYRSMDNKA